MLVMKQKPIEKTLWKRLNKLKRAVYSNSKNLMNDKEFVLEAIKQNESAKKSVNIEITNSKDFVLKAVKVNGCLLEHVLEKLRKDEDNIMKTIDQMFRVNVEI